MPDASAIKAAVLGEIIQKNDTPPRRIVYEMILCENIKQWLVFKLLKKWQIPLFGDHKEAEDKNIGF